MILCFLSQLEGEAKGTRHQMIAAGPKSYTRIWIRNGLLTDKEETVASLGQQGRVPRATSKTGTKDLVSQQAWAKSGGIGGVMSGKELGPSSQEGGVECERKVNRME